jgi:chitinase
LKAWIASLPGPNVVAPPLIDPPGGDFQQPIKVRLRHDEASAEIRYTLDGSPPTEASPLYTVPLELTSSTTLRARAFQHEHTRSIAVHETYIFSR